MHTPIKASGQTTIVAEKNIVMLYNREKELDGWGWGWDGVGVVSGGKKRTSASCHIK